MTIYLESASLPGEQEFSVKKFGELPPMGQWVRRLWFGTEDFEVIVNWYDLSERDGSLAACMEIFQDEWHAFSLMPDVLEAMSKVSGQRVQPEKFKQLLASCGYTCVQLEATN